MSSGSGNPIPPPPRDTTLKEFLTRQSFIMDGEGISPSIHQSLQAPPRLLLYRSPGMGLEDTIFGSLVVSTYRLVMAFVGSSLQAPPRLLLYRSPCIGLEDTMFGSFVVARYLVRAVASVTEGDVLDEVVWWQYRCPLLTQASMQSLLLLLHNAGSKRSSRIGWKLLWLL